MDQASAKKPYRKMLEDRLNGMSDQERASSSRVLCEKILGWPIFAGCQTVISFYPMKLEPAILPLLQGCIGAKTVALVRTPETGGGMLDLHVWSGSTDELEKHPRMPLYQIRPDCPRLPLDGLDSQDLASMLVLVPGLGFTRRGQRIGHGKGWYDRFLARWPRMIRAAIAFESQLVEELPTESWDETMDYVISERSVIACPARK